MSKKVLLISENQIKAQSIIESNVDSKILSKVILNVQDIHLKSILGSTLFDEVIDSVYLQAVSGTTMEASLNTLVNDYIQPYLIHSVIAEFMVVNQYKVSNKGLIKMNDNASSAVTSDELEYAKNYFDGYSSSFKERLVSYLQENNLLTSKTDTDITSNNIGWYL